MTVNQKIISIRYSNRTNYYTLYFGGVILFGLSFLVLFRIFLNFIGLNPDGFNVTQYWDKNLTFGVSLIIIGSLIGVTFSFLTPFYLALKLTDKQGIAILKNDGFQLAMGEKNIDIPYKKVQQIIFTTIPSRRGYTTYRLIIITNQKKRIQGSYKEAWQIRKKNTKPSIWKLANELSLKTRIAIKHKINIWG